MNLGEALDWAADQLAGKRIADPRLEAELLLTHALNIKKSELILNQSLTIEKNGLARFKQLLARRLKHEPTAYLIGDQPFLGLNIAVDRRVLIPRPETEQLAEQVLRVAGRESRVVIADIGTGSGCLAIALAKRLPLAEVYGVDASGDALKLAKKNAENNGVAARCHFLGGNLLEPLPAKVNIIVANPPYIPTAEINKLQPEVKDWEPRSALDGGPDGLKFMREIIQKAPEHLTAQPPGLLFIEIGFDQGDAVRQLAAGLYRSVEIKKDLAGKERFLVARQ